MNLNSCSEKGEPRVETLLKSMLSALERRDADTYWMIFGMLLQVHEEIMKNQAQMLLPSDNAPVVASNSLKCKIEYGNETGPGDEGFWEWWDVTYGTRGFECTTKENAEWLAKILDASTPYGLAIDDKRFADIVNQPMR